MHQILVYGDSLSWGMVPGGRARLGFEQRWPGVVERQMRASGWPVRVIENCLNGRRTMLDDPDRPGRNGLLGLAQCIEINSPLALAILLLGTNDFYDMHDSGTADSAKGLAALIDAIRSAPLEPGMQSPPILAVAPPPIVQAKGDMAAKFTRAPEKMRGLAEAYRAVACDRACHFLDSASVISASSVDGIHLDADQHLTLGNAVARKASELLA